MAILLLVVAALTWFGIRQYQRGKALRFVAGMGNGWNLGNSLDAHGKGEGIQDLSVYESYWGNPPTTKKMIEAVKSAGFNTVRIPVTWYEHMHEDGTIESRWLDRVQEVVDYAIEKNMYVIINLHHDRWYEPTADNAENAKKLIKTVWRQIADRFEGYDQHLLFEAMNEPRLIGHKLEWKDGDEASRGLVNELNEIFVETVRASGENNAARYLMLPTYAAIISKTTVKSMRLPDDDKIIVSVHSYTPYKFAGNREGTDEWSSDNESDTQAIRDAVKLLESYFIKHKIPVIIGEFGAVDKYNDRARARWTEYYVGLANSKGIPCIWWDNGGARDGGREYQLLDRYTLEWIFPDIAAAVANSSV